MTASGSGSAAIAAIPSILDELDAGTRRAAVPDLSAPAAGARTPRSRRRSSPASVTGRPTAWDLGDVLRFRDRVGLPLKRLLDGPEAEAALAAGRPWRIVPGGTRVGPASTSGPGVVIMPPSFVNVGAWIGEDTMVDSHVLVGSCAQIGARVHLSAGVTIGGVLEPAGARPVIVEDDAFVGAGRSLLEGVLVGAGAVIGAGVVLTGTSRLYDLVRGRVLTGHARGAARGPAGAVVVPGHPSLDGESRGSTGWRGGRAAGQGPRCRNRRPGRPGGRASMTLAASRAPALVAAPARLGGAIDADGARERRYGTPLLRLRPRRGGGARSRRSARRCRASFDLAYAVKANPLLAVLRHLAGLGVGADVASGGELRHVLRAGFDPARVVFTGPGQAGRGARGGRRGRRAGRDGRVARASCAAWRRSPRPRAGASRCCSGCRRRPRAPSASGSSATTARASSGWTSTTCAPPPPRPSPRRARPLGIHAFGASNVLDAEGAGRPRGGDRRGWRRASRARPGSRCGWWTPAAGSGSRTRDDEPPLDLAALGARLAAIAARLAADAATAGTECCWSRGGSSSVRPARTWRGSSSASGWRAARWRSSTAASTTSSGRRSWASSTGSALTGARRGGGVRRAARSRWRGRCAPASTSSPATPPLAGAAVPGDLVAVLDVGAYGATESMPLVPQPPDARRGGRARRHGAPGPSAGRARDMARLAPGPGRTTAGSRAASGAAGPAAPGERPYTPPEYDARPTPPSPSRSSCPSRA